MNPQSHELWSRLFPHFGDPHELYVTIGDWLRENLEADLLVLYRPTPLKDLPLEDVEEIRAVLLRGRVDLPDEEDFSRLQNAEAGLLDETEYLKHITVDGRWYGAVEASGSPPDFLDSVLETLGEFLDLGSDYQYHRERSGMSQWLIETGEILETSRDTEEVVDRLFELVCRRLDVTEAGYYTRSGSYYQLVRSYGFDVPSDETDRDRNVIAHDDLLERGLEERDVLVETVSDEEQINVYLPLQMGQRDLGLIVLYNYPVSEGSLSDFDRFVLSSLSTLTTITLNTMEVQYGSEEQAIEDDLTGLKTADYFMEQLNLEIERGERYGLPCSLLVVEIENYEDVLETHGQEPAREVLRKLGHLIRRNFRRIDVGGRLSEDELAILYPNTNLEEAMTSSSRLSQLIPDPFLTTGETVSVEIRGGVSGYPRDGSDGESLIKQARLALYEARQKESARILSTDKLEGSEA